MIKKFGLISITIFLILGAFPALAFQAHEHNQEQAARNRHRDRWYWQMPHRTMDELGIKAGMTFLPMQNIYVCRPGR